MAPSKTSLQSKTSLRARQRNLFLVFVVVFSGAYLLWECNSTDWGGTRRASAADSRRRGSSTIIDHSISSESGSKDHEESYRKTNSRGPTEAKVKGDSVPAMQQNIGRGSANSRTDQPVVTFRTQKKVKGNARPDLLYELDCEPKHVERCPAQGVGPSRNKLTSKVEHVSTGTLKHRAPGTGGPSGCKEAWITALGNDGFLPAVLVLLHTIRKYAKEDRDFIALVSSAVSEGVRQRLAEEAVRVIVVDPFENNERARQLVSQSARYRSGYWVVKMFVWRFEEYIKMVYVDADMYMRQNTDSIFCSPTNKENNIIAVTPRSSFDTTVGVLCTNNTMHAMRPLIRPLTEPCLIMQAGFNAGMFVYNPSNEMFDSIMAKFLALSQGEMLATSEQDFLNAHFKDRYFLIPIDYIMKHRRMVKERKLWDENRVHGYHMNGSPKPWEPEWRMACAYPKVSSAPC